MKEPMKEFGELYLYRIFELLSRFRYEIYTKSEKRLIVRSEEWFDSRAKAEFAAIGHIDLLEKGESQDA